MKKLFLFLFLWMPIHGHAESITNLEVLNGVLSREFETNNNVYSVTLNNGEDKVNLKYELKDQEATVETTESVLKGSTVTTLTILNSDGTKESYTFYINKEIATPVFQTQNTKKEKETKIPYLEYYVSIPCLIVILFLFKGIVLGFKK